LTFNLTKGLLYGLTIGLLFGLSIFLIGTVAFNIGFTTLTPVMLASLMFGNGVLGGITHEYGAWLKKSKNGGLIFGLTNGLLNGLVLGMYFGLAVFLLSGTLFVMGWLILTPIQMASLTFAACILMFITYEYTQWLDIVELKNQAVSPPATPALG